MPSGGCGIRSFGQEPLGGEPPQGDEQFPGERDDEYLAHAPTGVPEPLPEPRGEAAAGLVAEPEQASSTAAVRTRRFPARVMPCSRSMPPLAKGVPTKPA
jgi:hypothetical protein